MQVQIRNVEREACELLRQGCSDEEVEQRLGVSLQTIVGLRAEMAAAVSPRSPSSVITPSPASANTAN